MQAIVTKFLPATNVRGSRVKATCQAGSVTMGWEHAWNIDENHRAAALALATKLGWSYGKWSEGALPSGELVWVCEARDEASFFTVSKAA